MNQPPQEGFMRVLAGQVVALRLFDLAYGIDLKRAEALWAERAQGISARSRLAATPAKAVSFGDPPLVLDLGQVHLDVGAGITTVSASARLYDFGIVALALRVPSDNLTWLNFTQRVNEIDRAVGPAAEHKTWNTLLDRLRGLLQEALDRPTAAPLQEDYLIATVTRFDRPVTAAALMAEIDLVPLLSGEQKALADSARRDVLRHQFSYFPDDLVVLTWDRAFILEPRGDADVADVLEMANAQLLEMRTYDEMLDAELPRMRDFVHAAHRRGNLLAARHYSRLARRLNMLVSEVTELTERVDNALQVTEDVYLARVYAAAMEQFRVGNVSAAVDRKLAIIRETYAALHGEAAGARAELLEVAILVLIALEIVLSVVRH